MQLIEHIVEPERLLLSWQPPRSELNRMRLFVGELRRDGNDADLVYLTETNEFRQAKEQGFEFYHGFKTEQNVHKNVLNTFTKRLPPRNRRDFNKFLKALRIKPDAEISDFALLGYSGARLPDDTFTVIHPFDSATPPFEFMMEVQGYRFHMQDVPYETLSQEMTAKFAEQPDNKYDPEAIRILVNRKTAGYVCRGLQTAFRKWWNFGWLVTASLERINGTPEDPEIFLYVSVKKS